MKIQINGTDYEINSQADIDALYERFNFPISRRMTLAERFSSLNILVPSRFPSFQQFVRNWCN